MEFKVRLYKHEPNIGLYGLNDWLNEWATQGWEPISISFNSVTMVYNVLFRHDDPANPS